MVALGVASQTAIADGTPDMAYACAPGDRLTPELFSAKDTHAFPTWDTLHKGWWSPYAELARPTGAVAGAWYLTCTQWAGYTQVGVYLVGNGQVTNVNGPNPYVNANSMPIPGVYPVIKLSTARP
jgi:hypothetical protein